MSGVTLLGVLDPVVGGVFVVVGALVWWRRRARRAGALLVLAGVCWYAGALLPSLVALHRGPFVHLIATYPSGRARRLSTIVLIVLGWLLALVGGIVEGPWPSLAVAALLGGITTVRATQAATRRRHVLTPDVVGGLSLAAVLVVAGANLLVDLDADLAVALAYDIVLALVVVTLGADLWRTPATDDEVAEVLTGVGSAGDSGPGLQPQLRRVLGDPGLTIGYWSPDRGTYVDEHGRQVAPAERSASTFVSEDGHRAAVIFHDPALSEDPGLLEGAAAAVRLTVANAGMRREALDRVARLAEARRRIVEAADVEAQALAARLEGGPQSRLREVSRALSELDTGRCPDSGTAAAVLHELEAAHRELQELAHGVRPRGLTGGGLARALPSLAAGMPVTTGVTVEVGRLDAAVEAGLYFFCAEGLANVVKHASASQVRIRVRAEPGAVVAEVVDDGTGGADPEGSGLRGLRDRIEALGGTLKVGSDDDWGGVRLVARIPEKTGSR
jgi:hypothetical protein